MKLTDTQCKNAPIPEKGSKQYPDGGGLYLEVRASGTKYWRMKYTSPISKKQTILHLGTYPQTSLKAARAAHQKALLEIHNGNDPKEQKKSHKAKETENRINTFETVARTWHADRAKQANKWTQGHSKRVLRSLELHIFPYIGDLPIAEITPSLVLAQLKQLEAANKIDTAHKVYDVVYQVFSYAVRLRLCIFNPAAELRRELATVQQKSFPHILDRKKLAELLRVMDGYTGLPQTRGLLQISPYLFSRPTELREMKWADIDFKTATWEKAGEIMKNGLPHFCPLPKQVLNILESLKPFTGHYEYVFYNPSTKKPLSDGAIAKVLHRKGYQDIMTQHGFRHTASTILNEMGYRSDWIEAQLAHKDQNKVRASYNKAIYLDGRREMLQEWADYLDNLKQQENN